MRSSLRIGIVMIGTALLPAALAAQVYLGIKGGASFAALSTAAPDWKTRTGFAAGLALDMRAGPIGIEPEALYVQEGVKFNGTPASEDDAPHLGYLTVPVLVKLRIPTPVLQPFGYAGPSVNFRLSCSYGGVDCKDMTRSVDYGAVLGAGVRFGGNTGFTVEGRYIWGLKNIHDPDAGVDNKTRTFALLAGVTL
ncbi:MAG: porin family protein [Gemmatimonadales bacterium]